MGDVLLRKPAVVQQPHLGGRRPVAFDRCVVLHRKRRRQLLPQREKALIVGAGHQDVEIVVPRDKAVVADGAEQRAFAEVIDQVVAAAERIYLPQDRKLRKLKLAEENGASAMAGSSCYVGSVPLTQRA